MLRFFLFATTLFFSNFVSAGLLSDILDKECPEGTARPTIVFGVDDTICENINESFTKEKQQKFLKRFPEAQVINYQYAEEKFLVSSSAHIFFPYMGEVFLEILQKGWNVCFFFIKNEGAG